MLAIAIEAFTTLLTLSGLAYLVIALLGTRAFARHRRAVTQSSFTPGVSILKPVRGIDPSMYAGFASHCRQQYAGGYEILFGVSSLEDPAVTEIERLQAEFPVVPIRIIHCPLQLGTSGKVSNLVQMLPAAAHAFVLINDSDILVSPHYLERVMQSFADDSVGMVTAPYRGRAADTLWSRLEALGISTDFFPGVVSARWLEKGIRFGLGSTLAMRREALQRSGGLESLVDSLADDYEMGARIAAAGYRVELSREVVETTVPAYTLRGFWDHQIRWSRTVRDSRKWGYAGLVITYAVPWALMTCIASGAALWSFSLLSLVLLARMAVALSAGVGVLGDTQVLRDLWLLPLRDLFALVLWFWSFADDTIVWRGERFHLRDGKLTR